MNLEKLGRCVLYYDTDSCIYLSTGNPNEYEPDNFLGDMTNSRAMIVEVISSRFGWPKILRV